MTPLSLHYQRDMRWVLMSVNAINPSDKTYDGDAVIIIKSVFIFL